MSKAKLYLNKIRGYMESQNLRGRISFLRVFLDIVISNILYGATITDYFVYRFYNKTHFARREFMTARDKRRFYKAMNDEKARWAIQNKDSFNEKFAEYIKRESISTPECGATAFFNFLKKHEAVFIKPVATGGGSGIEKVATGMADPTGLWNSVLQKGKCVVEAVIPQHPLMAQIHPQSINSIRVATIYDGDEVRILFAVLRCGTGESFIDNHSSGGITMLVDPETGRVRSIASGKKRTNIFRHPDTGVFLPGFEIPHWDKCVALVKEAATRVEGIRYVGWDLAIMPDDVCLIEANPSGDFNIYQESTQIGCKAEIDTVIKQIQEKNKV